MATNFIDSRFPSRTFASMQEAVDTAAAQRPAFVGPIQQNTRNSLDGVETEALQNRPAPMGFATPASDRMAALGRSNVPAAPPPPTGLAMSRQTPVPMQPMQPMRAPVNPLGGMDPRPLSSRGGPMAYSQQGVGTTNPNAYAVGQNRAPLGMRLLERAARRRDPRAIMALASMEQQNAQQGQQIGMMQMREAADAARFDQQQQNQMTMFERQQLAMQQRDATEFQQQQQMFQMQSEQRAGESALAYQRRLEEERAQREAEGDPTQVRAVPVPGTDYVIPYAGNKAMGTLQTKQAEAPLPAGLVPTGAMRGGVQYGPAETGQAGKAPAFTYEKDPSGKITGAVYPVQDPQTGQWRLQRADINGDGVVSPEEAAAVPVAAAAASAALKTKGGNSYTLK